MGIIQRAAVSIRYYWKRAVIVTLIFTCLFTAFIVVFLTWVSSENQIECLQKYLGNSIAVSKVMQNEEEMPALFTEKEISEIRSMDSINGVNVISTASFVLKNVSPYIEDLEAYEAYRQEYEAAVGAFGINNAETNCSVYAMTDSEKMLFFTGSGFELVKGAPITEADKGKKVALISEQLAETNGLKIGDTVVISLDEFRISMGMSSAEIELEIAGIFSCPDLEQGIEQLGSYPANYIMVPETFLLDNYRNYPEILYVYAENSYEIPEIIGRLEAALPEGNSDPNGIPSVARYQWDENWVTSVSKPLEEVRRLSFSIMLIIGIVMFVLISLIGALLTYKKSYEYYILKSRGESKSRIVLQTLAEYLPLIIISSLLAAGLSLCIRKPINDRIMKPYVRLYDTYLQEYKDKEELAGDMVDISEGLRSYSAGIRNLNQNIPLYVDVRSGMILILVLYAAIPGVLALETVLYIRGNSIRPDSFMERS